VEGAHGRLDAAPAGLAAAGIRRGRRGHAPRAGRALAQAEGGVSAADAAGAEPRGAKACGAKLRGAGSAPGAACTRPPLPGKRRCRRHGGAPGTGAPEGNRNRLVHGLRSAEAVALRKRFNALLRQFREALKPYERG
jgi:hypothetical protein